MKISIQNFQSLANVEIEASGLTVIKGRSNLGKSAFIRALQALLYNKRGDGFIRSGARSARVMVDSIPTVSGNGPMVVWEKGQGVNRYQIGDQLYDKIGSETPAFFSEWGYKDIKIDNEYLRPNVSEQHDRIFLLDRAGSFISDVLSKASRLSVLLAAVDRCSGDSKKTKSVLNVRRIDAQEAEAVLLGMQPIIELVGKVRDLGPKISELMLASSGLDQKRRLVQEYSRLSALKPLVLPEKTAVPPDFGANLLELRGLVQVLKRTVDLPKLPEEKFFRNNLKKIKLLETRREEMSAAFSSWQRLKVLPKLSVETVYWSMFQSLSDWHSKSKALASDISQFDRLNGRIRLLSASLNSLDQELEQLTSELTILKDELGVCPVCDQPLKHVGVA